MSRSPSGRMQALLSVIRRRSRRQSLQREYRRSLSYLQPSLEQLEQRLMMAIDFPAEIVVGRTLSAYSANDVQNNQLKLTYSVYNQREIPIDAVRLADTLKPGVTFVAGSQPPIQNGQDLTWSLGTIPAYGRASVEITVSLAAGVLLQLDEGAHVLGIVDATNITDDAPPAILRSSPIIVEQLSSTPDANATDPVIQEKAAELNYDPASIFAYLRDEVGYESYVGSLRGARGALWSEAGNSLDEASLGVALFRASGIPSRYAHGTLSDANAQSLILSMFPEPTQMVGYLAPGTEVGDPAHDLKLLAETREHYWLQIDVGAGFQNADTSGLPGSAIGSAFTTTSGTFNEIANSLRHKMRISLEAETYSQVTAAFNGGTGLTTATVLDMTWNAVDLVGKPLSVAHFVTDFTKVLTVFSSRSLSYTPYFQLGDTSDPSGTNDEIFTGTPFQEVLTNFPFGSTVLTGLTLNMDLITPGGNAEHQERMLVDRIGFAARQNSSNASFSVDSSGPASLSPSDSFTLSVIPGKSDPRDPVQLEANVIAQQQFLSQFAGVPTSSLPADYQTRLRLFMTDTTRLLSLRNNQTSDDMSDTVAKLSLVRAYADTPRLVIVSGQIRSGTATEPGTTKFVIDLRRDTVRVVIAPGQSASVKTAFNIVRGIAATVIEKDVIASTVPVNQQATVINTDNVFQAADAQGISLLLYLPSDLPSLAIRLSASAEVLARITEALRAGRAVIAPERPVQLGNIQTTAWYEVDPLSGMTVGVGPDGGHVSAVEYAVISAISAVIGAEFNIIFYFRPNWKRQILISMGIATAGATGLGVGLTIAKNPFAAALGSIATGISSGFAVGYGLASLFTGVDPVAEGQLFNVEPNFPTNIANKATTLPSTAGQTLRITPNVSTITTDQNTLAAIPFSVVTDLAGDYTITATAPNGWLVTLAANAVTVTPAPGTQSGTGSVRLVARSNTNPDRVARADVAVTITATVPGVTLDVVLDPLTTVPFRNAQLPTSYEVVVRNLGPAAEPYTLTFSNVTPGWEVITTSAGLTIPAGVTAIRGVYLRPTGTTLPAPGTPVSFKMTVTSATNPARTQAEVVSFAMPEVAATVFFPSPAIVSTFPGATVNGIVSVQNNGNITQTVTLSAGMLPTGFTLGGLPQTLTLAPRDVVDLPYTLTVASTVQLFATAALHLSLDKTQTGATEAYALDVPIRVVVPGADAIANAGLSASQLGKFDLADRLGDLSTALTNLVLSPTDPIAKSQSVAALDAVIAFVHADPFLSVFNNDFDSARTQLVNAVTLQEVQNAVVRLGGLLDSFSQFLGDAVHHGFTFGLASNVVTALPGVSARFPILLENKGTQATTFDLSVGGFLPFGTTASFTQSTVTLQPGERLDFGPSGVTLSLSFTGSSIFPTGFTVNATPQEAPSLVQRTSASVAVRAEFIQVASVTPSPAFTEPGGLVAISARILNVVNREQVVLVSYRVTDSNGSTVFASPTQAVTLNVQSSLMVVALPGFDTTSLARNDYTVTVLVTDASGTPIPGGSGQASLLVGTPVSATLAVSPDSLLSIDSTVANTLRLESHSVFSNPLTLLGQVQTIPTATTILVRGDIAYVAGTNGIDIVNVANPSAPQIVGTFGQGLIVQGGFTVVRALSADRIIVATRGFLNAATFTLLTYSISNPTAPVLLGQSNIAEAFISDLFIVGNRALATTNSILFIAGNVISQNGDVLSVDLTNPAASNVTDELFGNGADNYNQNGGEVVDASTLYVASTTSTGGFSSTQQGNGVVRVIDYSDPANLSQIRQVTIPGTVQVLEIAVEGSRALVVGSTGGWKSPFLGVADAQLTGRMTLTLLDITDRRNPVVLGTTLVTESLNRPIDTADGGAKLSLLALGNGRFAISRGYVDGKPVLLLASTTGDSIAVASIDVPSLVNEMAIVNGKLYTTGQSGLLIYNVGNIEGTASTVTVHVPNSNTFPNVNRVRANSFNIPPDRIIPGAGSDTLVWNRPFAFGTTSSTLTWQTDIAGLVPGESRDVTTGTNIAFTHAGTPGAFALPATSVVGQNAVAISPASRTVAPGAPATYIVTLTNPTNRFLSFNLSTSGVPTSWVDLPRNVFVDANSTNTVTLRLTAPATSPNGKSDFVIFVSANGSAQGTAQGTLTLAGVPILPDSAAHGVVASIAPSTAIAGQGTDATYVVRLTNTGSETETFALSSVLPLGVTGAFESTLVTIPSGTSNFREITLVLTPAVGTATGQYPFTVMANSTNSNATNSVTSNLEVVANGVSVNLNSTKGIPGDTFQITVTNTGTVADTFDLKTAGPAGVTAALSSSQLTLAPNQSRVVNVTTEAVNFVVPGTFNFTVFARSQSVPTIAESDSVELEIRATKGIASRFDPATKELPMPGSTDFLLFVDNIGNTEDSYTATISATDGAIAASLIGLDGKPTQTIPIFRLPGLATGSILLNAAMANAGQGTVRIQIRSLTDGTLLSDSTATLSALAVPPVANADSFALVQGDQSNLDLLRNDRVFGSTFNLNSLQFRDGPAHASITLTSNGTVFWTPDPTYYGLDAFSYRAADSNGLFSNWALVSMDINGRPIARDDEAYVGRGSATLVEVLHNDNDPDGLINDATIEILSSVDPAIGQVDVINHMLRFVPSSTFDSSLIVQYRVIDAKQAASAPASVLMGVYNQNPFNPLDVDRDTFVSPLDVLLTVNSLNAEGARRIAPGNNTAPFYDVNADGSLSPLDTLTIINYLNARGGASRLTGEGEQSESTPMARQPSGISWLETRSLEKVVNASKPNVEVFQLGRTRSFPFDLPRRSPERNPSLASATRDQSDDMLTTDFVFAKMEWLELGEILDIEVLV